MKLFFKETRELKNESKDEYEMYREIVCHEIGVEGGAKKYLKYKRSVEKLGKEGNLRKQTPYKKLVGVMIVLSLFLVAMCVICPNSEVRDLLLEILKVLIRAINGICQ